jgi:hypothetical protein
MMSGGQVRIFEFRDSVTRATCSQPETSFGRHVTTKDHTSLGTGRTRGTMHATSLWPYFDDVSIKSVGRWGFVPTKAITTARN